ncbi:hypothetical protein MUK42_37011 [Musa troglodytarum]|uniref:Uncharacterized protein n=1 Tax=Musa troglodytarum TaxID=320322 RepID=A0A9E7JD56_9LILI|nr:hypothetical protein MUK42_37011 [Musa troglodytarum]
MTGGGCGGGDGCVGSSGRGYRSRGGSISLSFRPSHRSPTSHLRSTAAGLFSRDASPRWFSSRRSYDLVDRYLNNLHSKGKICERSSRALQENTSAACKWTPGVMAVNKDGTQTA